MFKYTEVLDCLTCQGCGYHGPVSVTIQEPPGIAGWECPKCGKVQEA